MSYCRWSSMDFACDIYAYESVGDFWQIYVAGNRVLGDIPKMPNMPAHDAPEHERHQWIEDYVKASKAQSEWLQTAEREEITLPYAGASIECATLDEFEAKLHELRALGYRFPDHVFEEIALDREAAVRRELLDAMALSCGPPLDENNR